MVVGDEAGESKLKKAQEKNVETIDEDFLLNLIRTKPGKRSKYEIEAEAQFATEQKKKSPKKTPKKKEKPVKSEPMEEDEKPKTPKKVKKLKPSAVVKTESNGSIGTSKVEKMSIVETTVTPPSQWVDKYKPAEFKKIVGQTGAASCANKLMAWLKNWEKNQNCPKDQRPKPKWTGKGLDDPTGASFRAALLSGPPGVGKTTTALLVAKECGMETIEFNASDSRSKKTLSSGKPSQNIIKKRIFTISNLRIYFNKFY